jgi:hypothetical protein
MTLGQLQHARWHFHAGLKTNFLWLAAKRIVPAEKGAISARKTVRIRIKADPLISVRGFIGEPTSNFRVKGIRPKPNQSAGKAPITLWFPGWPTERRP